MSGRHFLEFFVPLQESSVAADLRTLQFRKRLADFLHGGLRDTQDVGSLKIIGERVPSQLFIDGGPHTKAGAFPFRRQKAVLP